MMTTTTASQQNTDKLDMIMDMLRQQQTAMPTYEGSHILVNEFIEQWLTIKRDIDISPKTHDNYLNRYTLYIKPFFEGRYLLDVSYDVATAFVVHLMKVEKLKAGYVRDVVKVLNMAMNEATIVRGFIPKNPCVGLHLPKVRHAARRPSITDEEIKALYSVSKGHHQWIAIPLLAQTGMRRGEMLALTWDDLQRDGVTGHWHIRINKTITAVRGTNILQDTTKTPAGMRMLVIPDELAALMMEYRRTTQQHQRTYIIAKKRMDKREDPRNFNRTMKRWVEKADIRHNISAHAFRHAMATRLFLEQVPLEAIKKQGGWRDSKMPSYYADEVQLTILQAQASEALGNHFAGMFMPDTTE